MTNEQNQMPDTPASAAELRELADRILDRDAMLSLEDGVKAAKFICELATLKASKQTQVVDSYIGEACALLESVADSVHVPQRVRDRIAVFLMRVELSPSLAEQGSKGDVEDVGMWECSCCFRFFDDNKDSDGVCPSCGNKMTAVRRAAPIETQAAAAQATDVAIDKIGVVLYTYWNEVNDTARNAYRKKIRAAFESVIKNPA